MAGIDDLKKCVLAGAELLNVISKIAHKQGIFVAFELVDELSALGSVSAAELKAEIAGLDDAERADLLAAFKAKLVLQDPSVEAKLESGADLLNDAVNVVIEAVGLINKAKLLFS